MEKQPIELLYAMNIIAKQKAEYEREREAFEYKTGISRFLSRKPVDPWPEMSLDQCRSRFKTALEFAFPELNCKFPGCVGPCTYELRSTFSYEPSNSGIEVCAPNVEFINHEKCFVVPVDNEHRSVIPGPAEYSLNLVSKLKNDKFLQSGKMSHPELAKWNDRMTVLVHEELEEQLNHDALLKAADIRLQVLSGIDCFEEFQSACSRRKEIFDMCFGESVIPQNQIDVLQMEFDKLTDDCRVYADKNMIDEFRVRLGGSTTLEQCLVAANVAYDSTEARTKFHSNYIDYFIKHAYLTNSTPEEINGFLNQHVEVGDYLLTIQKMFDKEDQDYKTEVKRNLAFSGDKSLGLFSNNLQCIEIKYKDSLDYRLNKYLFKGNIDYFNSVVTRALLDGYHGSEIKSTLYDNIKEQEKEDLKLPYEVSEYMQAIDTLADYVNTQQRNVLCDSLQKALGDEGYSYDADSFRMVAGHGTMDVKMVGNSDRDAGETYNVSKNGDFLVFTSKVDMSPVMTINVVTNNCIDLRQKSSLTEENYLKPPKCKI